MSGKPAARQGDMTQYGGSIVQGSAGVRIGAPTLSLIHISEPTRPY